MHTHRFLCSWLLLIVVTLPLGAQNGDVQRVKRYYDQLDYRMAISLGDSLLSGEATLTPAALNMLHRTMALAYFNLGEQDSSRSHFRSLLSIEPDSELDPTEVSPKIIDFFAAVKAAVATQGDAQADRQYYRYVMMPDRRVGATWRSALLPGWGQFYKGHRVRGVVLGAAFWGSVTAAALAWSTERSDRDRYIAASEPQEITAAYEDYNRAYKRRRYLSVAAALLWLAAVGDANLSHTANPALAVDGHGNVQLAVRLVW